MPVRVTPLITGQYYHIFNRGVARAPIFRKPSDYDRFIKSIEYYRYVKPPVKLSTYIHLSSEDQNNIRNGMEVNGKKAVEIICYSLLINHFHLLVKQTVDDGIKWLMRSSLNSYVRYFNTKHRRVGPLFQGIFKAVRIETDEQLVHLSRYIHLNPLTSYIVREKDFIQYPWSSLEDYLNNRKDMVNPQIVLNFFPSPKKYLEFIMDRVDYAKDLEEIKHLTLEKE